MNPEIACPFDPTDTVFSAWPLPVRIWRKAISSLCCLPDTGRFGLTPLRTHVLICGYPRSGSTMLQLMLQHAYPHALRFAHEKAGFRAAMLTFRNHAMIVSKQPGDIYKLHQLLNYYAGTTATLRPIVMIRDPRDVLTSHHAIRPNQDYFLDVDKWHSYDEHVQAHEDSPAVMVLKYEHLVTDVAAAQARLETFIGEPMVEAIGDFHTAAGVDFRDLRALNGLRAVESSGIGRWRHPAHSARIRRILELRPSFAHRLVELGYERDASWIDEYQRAAADGMVTVRRATGWDGECANTALVGPESRRHK